MRVGSTLSVTDGFGFIYECVLIEAHHKNCVVVIKHQFEKPKNRIYRLHLAFAPTKQTERNEWLVEKATEIGIDRITPIISHYSERKDIKIERLQKTVISAMKQSRQALLPETEWMVKFDDLIVRPFDGRKFIAHCYNFHKNPLAQLYNKGENALILIGPEGDFSESEVNKAISNGFEPISLGETRLRTETAAITAIHTIHVINNLK